MVIPKKKTMKKQFIILSIILTSFTSQATIHIVHVWDGYKQFVDQDITIQLGDTVQWLPLGGGAPSMIHTITSTNIPLGATTFDQIWQAPADTFFQYIPEFVGLYEYECTPHTTFPDNMIGSINVIDGTININDNAAAEIKLNIYPNPTSNIIFIDGLNSKTEFKIYSINGALVLYGTTVKQIDVSALKGGNYIIEIFGDKPRAIKILRT